MHRKSKDKPSPGKMGQSGKHDNLESAAVGWGHDPTDPVTMIAMYDNIVNLTLRIVSGAK